MINISIVMFNNKFDQINNLLSDILCNDILLINQIFLIDNSASSDLANLDNISSKVNYIHCPQNLGYGSANNIAIQKSIEQNIKYHLVINPDIRMGNEVLSKLVKYLDKNNDIGLAMPDIRYPDGSRQYLCKLLPSPLNLFSRRFLPKFISLCLDHKYNLKDADYATAMNVPSLSGCFMFLRVATLADVGGFDPRFFMYFEDVDLVRRIGARYKTMFYPEVRVIHEYAKGSYKDKTLFRYHIKAACEYFNKHGWLFDRKRNRINKNFLKSMAQNLNLNIHISKFPPSV